MACTCKSVHFEFQFWSFWAKARIFISFLENKGLYPFSKPVLRTLVTVQSILAGCIRRATFLESLMSLWCMSRISTAPKVHLAFLLGKMVKALLPFILSKTLSTKMPRLCSGWEVLYLSTSQRFLASGETVWFYWNMKEEETIEFWNLLLEPSFADCSKNTPLFLCLSKSILGWRENS